MDRNEKIVKSDEYKNKIRLDVCQSKKYTSHIQHGITSEMKSHHEKGVQGKIICKMRRFYDQVAGPNVSPGASV